MEFYLLSDILADVRAAIDNNMESDDLTSFSEPNQLSLDDICQRAILDAARLVYQTAPLKYIDEAVSLTDYTSDVNYSTGGVNKAGLARIYIKAPDDFFRLVYAKLASWDYGVTTAITPDHHLYPQQFSKYAVGGTPNKPMLAITPHGDGLYFEAFSAEGNDGFEYLNYLPIPALTTNDDGNSGLEMPVKLYNPIIYYTGGLTMQTLGDQNVANALMQTAQAMLV